MKTKRRWHRVLLTACCVLGLGGIEAGRAGEDAERSAVRTRVNPDTGSVTMLRGRIEGGRSESGPEAAARGFLARHASLFGFRSDLSDLQSTRVKEDVGGVTARFRQEHQGVPVFEGEVVVGFDPAGNIVHVGSGYVPQLSISPAPALSRDRAVFLAGQALGASFSIGESGARLAIVRGDKRAPGLHVAWEVQGFLAKPLGDWHVFVDARTGDVVRVLDLLKRAAAACVPCNPSNPGCGRVFHHDPVSLLQDPDLRDPDNVDIAQQGCGLSNLTGTGFLDGAWASTVRTGMRTVQPFSAFRSFNQNAVDEVNAYYHANRAKEYLTALGFPGVMSFSIEIDAHDPTLGDNSHFIPSQDVMEFGTGGVDDAQDPDIVYHEYGHAIQDNQVPNFGTSHEGGSAGEGFGDYWAASLTDDLFAPDLGAACVGPWNATAFNPYTGALGSGCQRRVDGAKNYPQDMLFEVHDDGEMWSAALWSLRGTLGAALVDPLVIKSHTFLTPTAGFIDAADAMLSADQALHAGAHAASIENALKARGLPRTGVPAPGGFNASAPFHCETNHPYAGLEYKECRFTQPGATRLRFHFATFNTEDELDYAYISDADFRQVQALSGTPFGPGGGFSAAVSGDTIVLRFKADPSIPGPGFVIDAVEYFQSAPIPAGRVPDLLASRTAGDGVSATWSASCAATDDDYAVYEGMLGDYVSHLPVVCSTSGLRHSAWDSLPGSRWFIITPRNTLIEGSYGRRGDTSERPPSSDACAAQSIAPSCP